MSKVMNTVSGGGHYVEMNKISNTTIFYHYFPACLLTLLKASFTAALCF